MNKLERWGAGVSLLCAVHCAATPFLVGALPLLSGRLDAHWAEAPLIAIAAAIGYLTIGSSFRRHRRSLPLVLFTLGLVLLGVGHSVVPHQAETAVSVLGGLTLAGAQLLNRHCVGACFCCSPSSLILPVSSARPARPAAARLRTRGK